ncbi:MAG: hypothetical protein Q9168_003726 [Polycauliona sp. 1 TL-2023]
MASAGPSTVSNRPDEGIDDIFNYNVDMEDVFRDVDVNMDAPIERQVTQKKMKDGGDELGVDEVVKITRKRQPVAKLDEDRLLSQAGIPKLRRITKERLLFKGKGHEYRDLARLLNVYQLWLDDLYPRAKFADGLAMIEKLGHKKRIQIMRREWIHEGKPQEKYMDATKELDGAMHPESGTRDRANAGDTSEVVQTSEKQPTPDSHTQNFVGGGSTESGNEETLFLPNDELDDEPPEDDLEAWLAETADDNDRNTSIVPIAARRDAKEDDFDDEEALAAMGYN